MSLPLSNLELEQKLFELPSLIGRKAESAEQLREAYEVKKAEYELEKAKEFLNRKAQDSKLTAGQLAALVEVATAHIRYEVIVAESAWRRETVRVEELSNEFAGIRKIAELRKHELLTIGGTN